MTEQPDLFGLPKPAPARAFDGETYDPARDYQRLDGLIGRVFRLMADGQWRTLERIRDEAGGTEASVSARLRDFRKAKYGSRIVERKHLKNGLYAYRLLLEESNG
jgi:hypothetical protein